MNKLKYNYLWVLLLTLVGLLPEYIIRCNLNIMWFFYNTFSTYYGDLWYCWMNYLQKGFPYPAEYPSGIQIIFRAIYYLFDIREDYISYFIIISVFLAFSAIISSLLLYRIKPDMKKLLIFWIFAPSFMFYGLLNMDFLPILTLVLAHYCFTQKRYYSTVIFLALGAFIKVFPIFLLPIYLLSIASNRLRVKLAITFVIVFVGLNLPFILFDYSAWSFPYIWQISSNMARNSTDGSWTWLVYQLFDYFGVANYSGKVSLLIFTIAYFQIISKTWKSVSLEQKLVVVMLLFLLTDRVYSPQYDLYLLPFLFLANYRVNLRWFYLLEIINVAQVFFCFWLKNHTIYLQLIVFSKYAFLILLLIDCLSIKNQNSNA